MGIIIGILILIILVPLSSFVISIKLEAINQKKRRRTVFEENKKKLEEERKENEEMYLKVRNTKLYDNMMILFCKRIDQKIRYLQENFSKIPPGEWESTRVYINIKETKCWIGDTIDRYELDRLNYKDFGIEFLYRTEITGFEKTLMHDLQEKYPEIELKYNRNFDAIEIRLNNLFEKYRRIPMC